jgi:NADP-dependent 3-hydroxy acid dehydrogenase YdfG
VLGALGLMRAAATRMVPRQEKNFPNSAADIVVLGSVVGRHISPFSALYGATKHAVHSLAEALRREIGPKGVRVTLVEPGFVLSGFQDGAGYSKEMVDGLIDRLGPMLNGAEIADAIHYAISRAPHVHVGDIVIRPTRQDYP